MFTAVPYLNFPNALEVLNFYEEKFGAEIVTKIMGDDEMFKDAPEDFKMPEEVAKQFVMNAEFKVLGQTIMVSDSWGQRPVNNEGVNICFTFDGSNEEEVEAAQAFFRRAVEAGSTPIMEPGPTEWTKLYGMFKDPFGISWMINAC